MKNKDRNAEIVRLWRTREFSASQIGAKLGVTRNVVITVVSRQVGRGEGGLDQRTIARRQAATSSAMQKVARAQVGMPDYGPVIPIVEERAPKDAKPLVDLKPNGCRWPYGSGPFVFCGHAQVPGMSYCEKHCRVAVAPPEIKPARRATAPRKVMVPTG